MYESDDYDDYGPNGLDPYNQSKDKIISTEGCFSCKINGRGKRSTDNSNSTLEDTMVDDVLNASVPLTMRLKLEQTKHRMNIIQLQPALRTLKVNCLFDFQFVLSKCFNSNDFNSAILNQ